MMMQWINLLTGRLGTNPWEEALTVPAMVLVLNGEAGRFVRCDDRSDMQQNIQGVYDVTI